MTRLPPGLIRRWRGEWRAVVLSILCYGSCGYDCVKAWFSYSNIPAEESKIRFDSRVSEAQERLLSYGVHLQEIKPVHNMRYMRRMEGVFSYRKR